MRLWTVFAALLLCGISYCSGQSLVLNGLSPITDCGSGLRAQEDRLVAWGLVNVTDVAYNHWNNYISFIIGIPTSGRIVRDACYVNIEACQKDGTEDCYCMFDSLNVHKVVLNLTATEDLSGTSVRIIWPSRDFKQVVASDWSESTLVYGQNSEVNTLHVNLENISLSPSEVCKIPARASISFIQYCCHNSPVPCTSAITFQGMTVSGSPCAVGNFIIAPDYAFKLSHEVCGRPSPKFFTCVGATGECTSNPHATPYMNWNTFCNTICIISATNVQVDEEEETLVPSTYSGYRNAAIFLASIIAIGLIIATVHRLDASLLFSSRSRRRVEVMNILREDRMGSNDRSSNRCWPVDRSSNCC